MTNLEKVNQITNIDVAHAYVGKVGYNVIKTVSAYQLQELDMDSCGEVTNFKNQYIDSLEEVIFKIIKIDEMEDSDLKQLAIIMIEELTGYTYNKEESEDDEPGIVFQKASINKFGTCSCGNTESRSNPQQLGFDESVSRGTHGYVGNLSPTISTHNDGLPYLHLAGKVFKECV